jgi:cell wall assembly regulator SMI1
MSDEQMAMMQDDMNQLKAELSEWRDLAQERLNHIRILEGRLAVIEKGCRVLDEGNTPDKWLPGRMDLRKDVDLSPDPDKSYYAIVKMRKDLWVCSDTMVGKASTITAPSLLGLIEKVGGAE